MSARACLLTPPLPPSLSLTHTRTHAHFSQAGAPLAGFSRPPKDPPSAEDLEQRAKLKPFWQKIEKKMFTYMGQNPPEEVGGVTKVEDAPFKAIFIDSSYYYNIKAHVDNLQIKFFNVYIWGFEWENLLYSDLLWVTVMMCYVFAYMCFHTGSYYLATLGFTQIVASLPISYFIYTAIFGIKVRSSLCVRHACSFFLLTPPPALSLSLSLSHLFPLSPPSSFSSSPSPTF